MQIFISYARDDLEIAKKFYADLKNEENIKPWLDIFDLLPGQDWDRTITQAIKKSDYFLALLSSNSVTKRGFIQKELRIAMGLLDEIPPDQIFIIPVRLHECNPVHEELQRLHWVDIFPPSSYDIGIKKILQTINNEPNNLTKNSQTLKMNQAKQDDHSDKIEYSVLSLNDVSHGNAKRYSANIFINPTLSRELIIKTINYATFDLSKRQYYRDEISKKRWGNHLAHVVWIFAYTSLEDVSIANWFCRSQWISESLNQTYAPIRIQGEDIGDNIIVDWNNNHKQISIFYHENILTKEEYLDQLRLIITPAIKTIDKAMGYTKKYEALKINHSKYLENMKRLEQELTKLYLKATDIGLPPIECKELSDSFQNAMATGHNIVLPFSDNGLKTWPQKNREYLVNSAIKNYEKDLKHFEFELKKIQ